MGEGAATIILEELEAAKAREQRFYGEIVGYGLTGDAYHITSPHPEGIGAAEAMRQAIAMPDGSRKRWITLTPTVPLQKPMID